MSRTAKRNGVRVPIGARDLLAELGRADKTGEVVDLRNRGRAIGELRRACLIRRDRVAINMKGRKTLARLGGGA
jgi:hypothetical protein